MRTEYSVVLQDFQATLTIDNSEGVHLQWATLVPTTARLKRLLPSHIPPAQLLGASTTAPDSCSLVVKHCVAAGSGRGCRVLSVGPLECGGAGEAVRVVGRLREVALQGATPAPVLSILNPVAGAGRGRQVWSEVQELLDCAGVCTHVVETTHAGHATSMVSQLDLETYSCAAIVGGDGTLHEVVQGLVRHSNPMRARRLHLCPVPAGSGNGVAASLGLFNAAAVAHAIVKRATRAVDAATVWQPGCGTRALALLSVQYGLLANLDIGTEHLRFMGGLRFTYGAVREITKWTDHRARLAWVVEADRIGGEGDEEDELELGGWPRTPLLDTLTQQPPPMSQPTQWPEAWTVTERNHVHFLNFSGPSWAALDANINPWGSMDDGVWELATDRCNGRAEAFRMLTSVNDGSHKDSPLFEVERLAAFALEPVDETTYLTIDGERFPLEPVYAEVHRALFTMVFCTVGQ